MAACPECGVVTLETTRFCPSCGRDNQLVAPYRLNKLPMERGSDAGYSVPRGSAHPKTFDQMFGLDPRVAFLAFVVDLMLFGTAAATMGLTLPILVPLAIAAGVVLGRITYKAQMKWYGDDHESAMIKASIIGLLTAIPVGIPAIVWVPSGLLGLLHDARKKLGIPNHS
jgi:hypothetical protein